MNSKASRLESRRRFLEDIRTTPKLMRISGSCEVVRDAEVCGIGYDSGLVSDDDLEVFAQRALRSPRDPKDMLESLIRHAERVRSDKQWPIDLAEHMENIETRPLEEQLEALEPGSSEFLAKLRSFRWRCPAAYARSRWKRWYEGWKEHERLEKEREQAQRKTDEAHAERLKQRREAYARKVGVKRPPGRPRLVALNELGRWYATSDQFGVDFLKKRHALEWARHLKGARSGRHERSGEYMLYLLDLDRNGGIRDRQLSEKTAGPAERGAGERR